MTPHSSPVVLITGASRGIGNAMVNRFKKEGWTVAACSRSAQNMAHSAADFKFACDVASARAVKEGVQSVLARLGRIDALINNAGLAGSNSMEADASDELWQCILDVNLNGTYYMSKQVMPHLPDQSGRIVNIASILALKGVPDATAYCAAKHAVLGFTRALAHLLAPRGITVNAICPGWTRTEMAEGRMKEIGIVEKDIQTAVPLKRFVEPAEVSDLAYFLAASPGASAMTGQALSIDGGVNA